MVLIGERTQPTQTLEQIRLAQRLVAHAVQKNVAKLMGNGKPAPVRAERPIERNDVAVRGRRAEAMRQAGGVADASPLLLRDLPQGHRATLYPMPPQDILGERARSRRGQPRLRTRTTGQP